MRRRALERVLNTLEKPYSGEADARAAARRRRACRSRRTRRPRRRYIASARRRLLRGVLAPAAARSRARACWAACRPAPRTAAWSITGASRPGRPRLTLRRLEQGYCCVLCTSGVALVPGGRATEVPRRSLACQPTPMHGGPLHRWHAAACSTCSLPTSAHATQPAMECRPSGR